jgi:hypothetical protein
VVVVDRLGYSVRNDSTEIFSANMKLFGVGRGFIGRPTHDRSVTLRQTDWFPREGKVRRRDDLARLLFFLSRGEFREPKKQFRVFAGVVY